MNCAGVAQLIRPAAIDEQSVQQVKELVASRAADRPVGRQLLVVLKDLFHGQVDHRQIALLGAFLPADRGLAA